MTSVTIPDSVTSIGAWAFENCSSLTNVTLPGSLASLPDGVFENCTSLTTVTIPSTVTNIGEYVFFGCSLLASITVPDNITRIEYEAFFDCYSLANVTIGKSVASIEYEAFLGCSSLTAITVDPQNFAYSSVAGVLFNKNQTTIIQYPAAKAGDYTITNSVTSIGDAAFRGCALLTSVTIGDGVTHIGNDVFDSCYRLTSVTIGKNVTSIGDFAFIFCGSPMGIYFKGNVPSVGRQLFADDHQVTVYYLPGTTGWGTTFCGWPAMPWRPQVRTTDASFGVRTNQFGFNITWASDMVVVVEVCTNPANPTWSPLQTNALSSDSLYFSDPQWTNYPGRFYRLRSP